MKRILLASASIVAFAGAAAAEVTFGGSATLGYNDDIETGFYGEADLNVSLTQELNNGLTAGATFGINAATFGEDEGGFGLGEDLDTDDNFVLFLTTEQGGLFFGDTAYAAESHWDPAGNMLADDFSEQDEETVIRGDTNFFGFETSVSYNVADAEGDSADDLDQLSIGAEGTVGRFTMSLGYQEESDALFVGADATGDEDTSEEDVYDHDGDDDFVDDEVFGISAGTTFGGADVTVGYANNVTNDQTSLGFEAAYPFGPVTLGAYYVLESDDANDDLENSFGVSANYASGPLTLEAFYEFEDDGNQTDDDRDDEDEDNDYGIEVGYVAGGGLEVYAGYIDETEGYVGIEYDLGEGSELIVSYAEQDEEGNREYKQGTTVAVSMSF